LVEVAREEYLALLAKQRGALKAESWRREA
jgi:hypothetical protein